MEKIKCIFLWSSSPFHIVNPSSSIKMFWNFSKVRWMEIIFLIAYNMAEKILGSNTIPNNCQISVVNNRETFGSGRVRAILR